MKTEVWKVASPPDPAQLKKAADLLKAGRLVIFPTETVYGVGALPSDQATLDRIYELKGRPKMKPFAWHLSGKDQITKLPLAPNPLFAKAADTLYPAPFTSIVRDKKGETVGIRVPESAAARGFIKAAGGMILATSANVSGKPSPVSGEMALQYFNGKVDLILDEGSTRYGGDSTVVDFTSEPFKILRPGVYSEIENEIRKLSVPLTKKKNILIVCTGNTCRSPMAEGWLRSELKRKGLDREIEVLSCGVFARKGVHVSFEADLLLKNEEIDISGHRSQQLTKEIVDSATRILAMSEEHRDAILELYPGAVERIKVLGIEDPIGRDIQVYKECYEKIKRTVKENWSWIVE